MGQAIGTGHLLIRGIVNPLDSDAKPKAKDYSIASSKLFL